MKKYLVFCFNQVVFGWRGILRFLGDIGPYLKRFYRLHFAEQCWFLGNRAGLYPVRLAPIFVPGLTKYPCEVYSGENQSGLCTYHNVRLITERQFALTGNSYLSPLADLVFASSRRLLPQFFLYQVKINQGLGLPSFLAGNYYHEIVEFYFQAWLARRDGIDLHLIQMQRPSATQLSIADTMQGLGLSSVWFPSRLIHVLVEKYHVFQPKVASIPLYPFNSDSELFKLFRIYRDDLLKCVPNSTRPVFKRIYATRRDVRRRLVNNADLEELFRSRGFEIVDFGQYSFADQIQLAQRAEILAGPHGANLTNIMFMSSGTRSIELMPEKKVRDDAYKRLSWIMDVDYTRIPLSGQGNRADIDTIGLALDSQLD